MFCQFSQSLLRTSNATGAPVVLAAAHARQDLRAIGFDRHAPAAAVAALAAAQFERDGIEIDRQARGQSLEDRDETLSV